jgi:hypothetical protein
VDSDRKAAVEDDQDEAEPLGRDERVSGYPLNFEDVVRAMHRAPRTRRDEDRPAREPDSDTDREQAAHTSPARPFAGYYPVVPATRFRRVVGALCAPLAVGASVAAGYSQGPTATETVLLVAAIGLTYAAGISTQNKKKSLL